MITDKTIAQLLIRLGCSISLKGFRYLKELIRLIFEDETRLYNLSTDGYRSLARQFGVSAAGVERAIRTEIQKCWSQQPEEIRNIALTEIRYQPSVKEFLSIVLAHLWYGDD